MNFDTPLALFQHLLAIDEENMSTNLPTLIDESHEFYAEVLALISAHEENKKQTSFNAIIGKQAEQLVEDSAIHELVDKQVGVYKLVKKLGQGGMGAVYLGERNDGQLEQKVAIKFVYPSVAALAGENFLQKEAQHLANLDHTNIAKIFTVDTAENELPYMVMEYVEGIPIDEYCESNNLNLIERLKLFQKVCSAVQFAHQNMVIHADIKPSNILVNSQGEPKLMDFGIARHSNLTMSKEVLKGDKKRKLLNAASKDFASPEQIESQALTTASDVFSLGKVLSCLVKKIKVNKELKAILKASQHMDKLARIKSALELTNELSRYTNNYPLESYQGGIQYPIIKAFQRNTGLTIMAVILMISTMAFITKLTISNFKLTEENSKVTQLSDYLISFVKSSDPTLTKGDELLVKDLLIAGYQEAKQSLISQPNIQATLLNTFSSSLNNLGLYQENINLFKDTETLIVSANMNTELYVQILFNYGLSLQNVGQYDLAKESFYKVISLEAVLEEPSTLISTYTALGELLATEDNHDKAINHLIHAIEIAEASSLSQERISAITSLSEVYSQIELYDDAIKLIKQGIDEAIESYGSSWHGLLEMYALYGEIHYYKSDFLMAEKSFEKAYKLASLIFGRTHNETAIALSNIAMLQSTKGNHIKSIEMQKEALSIIKKSSGEESHMFAETNNDIGNAYHTIGLPEQAIPYYQKAEEIYRKLYGNNHSDLATVISNRASSLNQLGLFDEVTLLQKESIKIAESTYGRNSKDVAIRLGHIGSSLVNQNRLKEARPYILESLTIGELVFGKVHDRYSDNLRVYARYLSASGEFEESEAAFKETIDICKSVYKTNEHSEISDSLNGLGELFRFKGEMNKSQDYIESALKMYLSLGTNQKKIMKYKLNLAKTYISLNEKDKAKLLLQEIINYYKENKGYDAHPDHAETKTLFKQLEV